MEHVEPERTCVSATVCGFASRAHSEWPGGADADRQRTHTACSVSQHGKSRRTRLHAVSPALGVLGALGAIPGGGYRRRAKRPIARYGAARFTQVATALAAWPVLLLFAVENALSEEFRFRCVLLATGVPVLGRGQAMLLTSVLFGLGHWFGHPSGPTGIVLAALAG